MINELDKNKEYVDHRVYRDSCVVSNGLYIKDLRVLGRDLNKVVIIDNAVISFGFQLDNGIPILPFYDDYSDDCLYKISSYLKYLSCVEDMRFANNAKFGLLDMKESEFSIFLEYYLSDDDEGSESPSSHENSVSPIKSKKADSPSSPVPLINLHLIDEKNDYDGIGTPTRKLALTKNAEKIISQNMDIFDKCKSTIFPLRNGSHESKSAPEKRDKE